MVYDKDFEMPLAAARATIAETQETVAATDEGNYVFGQVAPGTYTLVFSKEGYTRQVKADVVVTEGQMTEVDAWLVGEFTEMEEFVVQDVQIGTWTEAALLDLRMESPALMDSISSELMSQAGASDAASALKLVAGASVQDGKFAVIRGLPDRYVNSQMNGVRLPTADADKRAVQLDQFPAAAIESIQVSKTFTPDQQGDASGGAVNIVLKGIPEETTFGVSGQYSWNSQVKQAGSDFLTYRGGGVNCWGIDDGGRSIQHENIGSLWEGAVGPSTGDAPTDYKWAVSGGGKIPFEDFTLGGFASFFYERDSSYYENGIDDKYWAPNPSDTFLPEGTAMFPQYSQGTPSDGEFVTSLFDVTQASQEVKWGGMGVVGLETENHAFNLLYLYTRSAEDTVTIAEDRRGKEYYTRILYGEEYDPADPENAGNQNPNAAPYLRTETLEYTERTTQTIQLSGRHTLPDPEFRIGGLLNFFNPEVDWVVARSSANLYQPDKRLFGARWQWDRRVEFIPQPPYYVFTPVERWYKYQPAVNANMGNFLRVWKEINEDSDQYQLNFKLPFEQWSGDEGYMKVGLFQDEVHRTYEQRSFQNNVNELPGEGVPGSPDDQISEDFNYPLYESLYDIDYEGEQSISAWYYMADVPLNSWFNIIGGARYEQTDLNIINSPRYPETAKLIYPGEDTLQDYDADRANVTFSQADVLPSIGFVFAPFEPVTLRGSYSRTVARQTFKELSPITQMEYLGGDVFVGNPELEMSQLQNYDLRLDYTPYEGGLFSLSYFYKDVKDPIEYVQRYADFDYTTPRNYPEGMLSGYEFEFRQQLGYFRDELEGLSIGANATLIDSEVTLPDEEVAILESVNAPMTKRDMTQTPEHLYNFFMTYDLRDWGTQLAIFYTIRGDTLVAGAGQVKSRFVPSVYETEYGTLNFSLSQRLGEIWKLKFQAKNLLNPDIETVYRSQYIGEDVTKTSYKKGMDFSISLSAEF